jgi:lipopolysaccharide/colanic/teichoic acid biosynthesis glycosyltransferase
MIPPPEESAIPLEFGPQAAILSSHAARKAGWLELKYSLDTLHACCYLLVSLPLLAAFALAIKLTSKGPVFFRQLRIGENGRVFEVLKLRTLRVVANDPVEWHVPLDDPRVTRVGRFLRRTHLDRLPQLINVIRGDMSLVGPAPIRPVFASYFRRQFRQYERRFALRPGITGLAQVCYRFSETAEDVRKSLAFDLLYLRKTRFALDLSIMFLTLAALTRPPSR